MLGAFWAWIKLYHLSLKDKGLVLLAIMSFVCSIRMSYYAAELKPYSMDVFVVALFGLFLNYQKGFQDRSPTTRLYVLSGLLPFLIFFSYAGVFVFWIISYNFLRLVGKNKKLLGITSLSLSLTLACFAGLYFSDLRHSLPEQAPYDYWKNYFVGTESFIAFITPFGEGLRKMITWWFGNSRIYVRAATPLILFFMYALFRHGFFAWKREGFKIFNVGSLFAVMFLELLFLSMAHKYPFIGERVTLFLAPFVFYMIVKGINDLRKIKILHYGFILFYIGYLTACLLNTFYHHFGLFKFYG